MSRPCWPSAAGRHFGGPATIEGLRRESGGASRQTWSFDAVVDGTRHELILRRDPPTAGQGSRRALVSLDRATEIRRPARGLPGRRARARSAVRARVRRWPGRGLRHAPDRRHAIARKLLRDAPYAKPRGRRSRASSARSLARIHAVDPATPAAARAPRGRRPDRGPARGARPARPAAAGVRAGALLARPAQARADRTSRCWCTATTAPATISPTRAA